MVIYKTNNNDNEEANQLTHFKIVNTARQKTVEFKLKFYSDRVLVTLPNSIL